MHAVLVAFGPQASEPEMMRELGPRMHATRSTRGLIMKTFVAESGERWGGFYLFSDERCADAYLDGDFFRWFSQSELISDVTVRRFAVEDEPSIAFGTPTGALSERAVEAAG